MDESVDKDKSLEDFISTLNAEKYYKMFEYDCSKYQESVREKIEPVR